MTFKNEYVPPLEQETSEFFKKARETLRTGHSKYDSWTIDRERDMVLFRRGGGNSMESKDEAYWSFIVADREHDVDTNRLEKSEVAPKEIAITYSVSFRGDPGRYPNAKNHRLYQGGSTRAQQKTPIRLGALQALLLDAD